jgi:hypothetical protein
MRQKLVAFFGLLAVLTLLTTAGGMASAKVPGRNQLLDGPYKMFLPVIMEQTVVFSKHIIYTPSESILSYAADVDGDGDVDILGLEGTGVGGVDPLGIAWWENDGSENFTKHTIDIPSYSGRTIYATDMDGDGDVDVLRGKFQGIAWWENDGSGSFSKHAIAFEGANSVYATDMDGDGDVDVLTAEFGGNEFAWWENDGSESFSKRSIDSAFEGARSVYATDMDGDGDVDVLGGRMEIIDNVHHIMGEITWWENDGSESFIKHDNIAGRTRYVYATDLDGDGDVDVLGWGYDISHIMILNFKIAWWVNDGSENFSERLIDKPFAGVTSTSVYATDVDGDGDVDILGPTGAGNFGVGIAWWEQLP